MGLKPELRDLCMELEGAEVRSCTAIHSDTGSVRNATWDLSSANNPSHSALGCGLSAADVVPIYFHFSGRQHLLLSLFLLTTLP